jgi:hypothetical protein
MRARIIVGVALLVALLGVSTFASRAGDVTGSRQWTIVNFSDPVQVRDQIVMGPVLIVHDSGKMARGEACTTFYRFEPGKGPRQELLSFHCRPEARPVVEQTTFTYAETPAAGCKRLIAYQIGGDTEAHGIPAK